MPNLAIGVVVAVLVCGGPSVQQQPLMADDAAAISAAIETAIPTVRRLQGAGPRPIIMTSSVSLASCAGTPKQLCLDGPLKTLAVVIARNPTSPWPVSVVDAVRSRNAERHALDKLQLTSSTITSPQTKASATEGRAVVQVSLPAYVGKQAAVIVALSYGAHIQWAVLLQRNGTGWRVIEQQPLGQG